MIEPPPASSIASMAYFVPRNTPVALTAMTRFQFSRFASPTRGAAEPSGSRPETPAALSMTSSRP